MMEPHYISYFLLQNDTKKNRNEVGFSERTYRKTYFSPTSGGIEIGYKKYDDRTLEKIKECL